MIWDRAWAHPSLGGFQGREGFYGACRRQQLRALLWGLWAHLGTHGLCLVASCAGIVR